MSGLEGLLIVAIWFLAGFVNGISGMGGAIIAMPLLSYLIGIELAVPVTCIVGSAIALFVTFMYGKYCTFHSLLALGIGCLPGSLVGVALLRFAPPHLLQAMVGILLLLFVLWHLAGQRLALRLNDRIVWGLCAGFLSGVANTAVSLGGPPLAVHASLQNWDKDRTRGVLACFFVIMSFLTLTVQFLSGLYTETVLTGAWHGLPGALLGLVASLPFAHRIRQETFQLCLLFLIAVAGLALLFKAFS